MLSSRLDSWLSNLIRECWLMNPEDRPTAAAVSHILDDYLDSNDTVDDKTVGANETEVEFTLSNSPTSPHDNASQELEISSQQLSSQSLHSPKLLLHVHSSLTSKCHKMKV